MMNSNKNGSFKPKRIYFSQVSNTALRDCDRNMIHFAQPEILYNRADNCKLVGD